MIILRIYRWFDERLGASSFAKRSLDKIFPDHWSFMLGEIALYAFIIEVLTGIFLTFFYVPSQAQVVYHGPYRPLDGHTMSVAYQSVLQISFEVRAGLVFRQIHHWGALLMSGAVAIHAARIFFTGAFRKPRELNWVLGVLLLILTIAIGFVGYSLPDDLLSGTGLRIGYSIALSVPVIGTWMAFLLFGGRYPAPSILTRLFVIHVMILPALLGLIIGAHLAILWHQKHTNFPTRGMTNDRIRGERLWPRYAFKSLGLFFVTFGVLAALGGLVQINPIWLYGPYHAYFTSGAAQPDWYMGWTEGLLRLFPGWEWRGFGYEIPEPFFGVVVPGAVFFGLMFLWPWIEKRITGDTEVSHNLLQYPREVPWRTALGVFAVGVVVMLTLAGGSDVIASFLGVSIEAMTRLLRALVIVVPIVAGLIAYYLANELRASRIHPVKRARRLEIRRSATGGFEVVEEEGGGFESPEERLVEEIEEEAGAAVRADP